MRLLLCLCILGVTLAQNYTLGAYFVNWAHYRASPYTYTASTLQNIIKRIDQVYYSFIYFCPPAGTNPLPYWAVAPYGNCNDASEYQLLSVDPADDGYLAQIVGMKSTNSKLKVILSIGGWNFPSEYFSKLAASSSATQKFITSVQSWLSKYGVDGIDIDWEYPCSPPRTDPVEISCTDFRTVNDAGGKCPDDTNNIVTFLKTVKAALGSKLLTFASQAAKTNEQTMNIKGATPYVDMWHVMSYDYTVSDLPDASAAVMSPNAPLNNPTGGVQMSISSTVNDYLAAGVPASKIMVGVPYYGHTWYQPSLVGGTNWQKFGNTGIIQGACCGPFQQTYGAKYGKGCNMCGTMMYSEIVFGKPSTYYDNTTQSNIGFWSTQGADGWTEPGTWVTYNDDTSVTAITNWAKTKGLAGVFAFDTSMDSVSSSGNWTYVLTNAIAQALGGH